jgi:hypothetical protein
MGVMETTVGAVVVGAGVTGVTGLTGVTGVTGGVTGLTGVTGVTGGFTGATGVVTGGFGVTTGVVTGFGVVVTGVVFVLTVEGAAVLALGVVDELPLLQPLTATVNAMRQVTRILRPKRPREEPRMISLALTRASRRRHDTDCLYRTDRAHGHFLQSAVRARSLRLTQNPMRSTSP